MDAVTITTTSVYIWWWWIPILVWTLPWKGVALWRAAGNKHLGWFIALLLLNTLAILEIVYIFGFSRKRKHNLD